MHNIRWILYATYKSGVPVKSGLIFWDGVSYHHQQAMRDFLQESQADPPDEWKICCTRLAPYTPQENPVENIG